MRLRERVTLEAKPDLPLERYFKVLEAIAACREKLGVSDISHQCDLPLATSHRLLQNLAQGIRVTNLPLLVLVASEQTTEHVKWRHEVRGRRHGLKVNEQ